MDPTELKEKVEFHEHFFRDPKVGEGILKPSHGGLACENVRLALNALAYTIPDGDVYDEALRDAVCRFQEDSNHTSRDGFVGPNTRKLLTRAVVRKAEWLFERGVLISPEYAVFLSYSREDEQGIGEIKRAVDSCGVSVFVDKEAIRAGANWPDVIYRTIRKCQLFLCVLSPHSVESHNVLIELALARHAGRPIVPVYLKKVRLADAMQALIGDVQHIDLTSETEGLDTLARALSNHFGPPSAPA